MPMTMIQRTARPERRSPGLFDDFFYAIDGSRWQEITSAGGIPLYTINGPDAAGDPFGVLEINLVESIANREAYIAMPNPVFAFRTGVALQAEILLSFSEHNTNKLGAVFGFSSLAQRGLLADNTGLPAAGLVGALIFKQPGTTVWSTCSSDGTTPIVTQSAGTAGAQGEGFKPGSTYQRLRIECRPQADGYLETIYTLNTSQLAAPSLRPGANAMKDRVLYSNSGPLLYLVAGIKQFSATPELAKFDYIGADYDRGA